MKISLSTNWCNRRIESGEEIAERALELGFDELELGFHTPISQVDGFRRMLDRIPVGSIHAFCPVPVSAPQGYPELYTLASFDAEARAMARFQITRNIEFASDIGADTVVLHAGRVYFNTFFRRSFTSGTLREILTQAKGNLDDPKYAKALARALKVRRTRGAEMLELVKGELSALMPVLEKHSITLALENLPYLEGFPNESEMSAIAAEFKGGRVKAWFDTGHHRVREMHGWLPEGFARPPEEAEYPLVGGMHLNDVVDYNDDHLPPGEGKVDFKGLEPLARAVRHVVVEPNSGVRGEALAKGLAHIRALWSLPPHG